ncbi:hypothetical protein [Pontibacter sp. SGAir0037]|uniref:hypothetical protein n=1 Tax=Pontibacter sp. SGAir0037 TaxID=2571030 RepID=UPI0010CD280B|nr:hypothetical protein [Pontibacter sp. SGAir0037]QCR22531.1 hypothetical protein C1N53_09405 [Pontibacter sp. SGAir0037]
MNYSVTFRKLAVGLLAALVFTSCQKDEEPEPIAAESEKEFNYVRVLVTDEVSTKLTQLNPSDAAISTFDTQYPMGNLFATASGRYAAVIYGSNNFVQVFDTGLEHHVDHVDVKGSAKWAAITANGLTPAHFKSKGTESVIFNDGQGTLSVANEASFNTPGATFGVINAGLTPHHGAMAQFSNGTYAITESRGRVRIINRSGGLVHASPIEVANIHGNATDGETAVFGSFTTPQATTGGVLVVKQNGEQRVIANPDGFGAVRLGTILYAQEAKKFIGYGATKGAYFIDLAGNRITPIYEGSDSYQCKVDYAGNNLLILTLDGKLRIYDLASGTLKKEGSVISSVASSETFKPVLEATSKYAYIALPATGEVHQVSLSDFTKVTKHKVSDRPVRLAVLGFETNESH